MDASERIFADSNFFVALFNSDDSLNKKAFEVADRLDDAKASLVISNFIFLEIVTVLAQRCGRAIARSAGNYLLNEPRIGVIHIDENSQASAWRLFQQVSNKNVSFVDCSTIAIIEDEALQSLLTFDRTDCKKLQDHSRFKLYPVN